jgi:photosystem II stability/assembly factor-like uncharacterized protein
LRRSILALLALCAAVLGSACTAPAEPVPDRSPDATAEVGFGHVHGVDLNPADGAVYAATHHGVYRLGPAGSERIADRYQDTMGFTIAGPDLFLASGHPDPREPGPAHLGLITSTDRARTWNTVALSGEADFHALTASGATIYGLDATEGVVMRSDDAGRRWQRGAQLAAADLDVDPVDPMHVLATTEQGLQESDDGGVSFTPVAEQPPIPLVVVDHVNPPTSVGRDHQPTVVGIGADGTVWASTAGAWSQAGALPAAPHAFTVVAADRYLAATGDAVLQSEDAGRTWSVLTPTAG